MAPSVLFCGQKSRWSLTRITIKFLLTNLGFNASRIRTQSAYRDTGVRLKHCYHCILLDDCSHGESDVDIIQTS